MKKTVVTIGNFDGGHRGHLKIINQVKHLAKQNHAIPVVLSFIPHSRAESIVSLTTIRQERELFNKLGVKLILLNFSQISKLTSEEFVKRIIHKKLCSVYVAVGKNFRFGKNREGDVEILKRLGDKYNFKVKVVELLKEGKKIVSSTLIRKLLIKNKIEEANHLLGRDYEICGRVVKGRNIGKTIGFPTANLKVDKNMLLPRGVFAVSVLVGNKMYDGVANIGVVPTLKIHRKPQVEAYLFSFSGNLYGRTIKIFFKKFIRKEKRFPSLEMLKKQIISDIEITNKLLGN